MIVSIPERGRPRGRPLLFPGYAACVNIAALPIVGWERQQSGVKSVQETLEKALSPEVANHLFAWFCAGRTDCRVCMPLVRSSILETDAVRTAFNGSRCQC